MTLSLPLLDGCFVFDNSSLEKLQSCPYEYYLSQWRRRITTENRAGLNFGSACHSVLKYRYLNCGNQPCLWPLHGDVIKAILEQHFLLNPEPPSDYRNLNLATEWAAAYNNIYKTETFEILKLKDGKPMIERSFMRPFAYIKNSKLYGLFSIYNVNYDIIAWVKSIKASGAIPVFFSGRIDMGITDGTADWVLDHKSAYQFGSNFHADMLSSPQFIGYAWEFKYYFGRLPKGYIINAFRPRSPVKGAEYDSSLLWRTSGKDPDFLRLQKTITQADLDEWETNTFQMLEEVLFYYLRGSFGKHKKACVGKYGKCQFYTLCNEVAPEYREDYLMGSNYMDNNWSPLNKPEQKKETEDDKSKCAIV
jgi:hypothetical protein